MSVQNEILDELLEMRSPLAGASRVMPFPVPRGYFESLEDNIMSCISNGQGLQEDNVYTVPQGYFQTLPNKLLADIRAEEFADTLPKGNPYNRPAGYFEDLPQQILQAAKQSEQKKGATVIPWRQAMRWAAAAVVVLGISLGAYRMYEPPVNMPKALASLSKDSINAYIVQNVDDFETEIILNSLAAEKIIKGTNEVSEQEIIQYLNEEGWNVKTEIN